MKLNTTLLGTMLLAGCASEPVNSVVLGEEENPLDECTAPPLIDHDEISEAQPSNADVQIIAYVYADDGCEVDIMTGNTCPHVSKCHIDTLEVADFRADTGRSAFGLSAITASGCG